MMDRQLRKDRFAEVYRPYHSYPTEQYTDDTQLTIAIAKSIVQVGKVAGAVIAREFMNLWESGDIVGSSKHTTQIRRRKGFHVKDF